MLRSLIGNLIPNKWYQSYGDGSRFECLIEGGDVESAVIGEGIKVRKKKKKKFESLAMS